MPTARDLFDQLSTGITDGRFADLARLYSEDTVVEHPTAVPRPRRLEGRDAVHDRFVSGLGQTLRLKRHDVTIHDTADPDVIVAEYQYTAESLKTGRTTEPPTSKSSAPATDSLRTPATITTTCAWPRSKTRPPA